MTCHQQFINVKTDFIYAHFENYEKKRCGNSHLHKHCFNCTFNLIYVKWKTAEYFIVEGKS